MKRLPNREERKAYNKAHKTHYTLQDFAMAFAVQGLQKGEDINWLRPYLPKEAFPHRDNWELFPDGTLIRLNVEHLLDRPVQFLSKKFMDWVNENADETFVLYRDKENADRRDLVGVHYQDPSKDTTMSLTWLFDLYYDLLVWSELENKFVEPQRIEDQENAKDDVKQLITLLNETDADLLPEEKEALATAETRMKNHEMGIEVVYEPMAWQNTYDSLQTILDRIDEEAKKLNEEKEQDDVVPEKIEEVADEQSSEMKIDKEGGEE